MQGAQNRNVLFIPKKSCIKYLTEILKKFNRNDIKQNLLYCNDGSNENDTLFKLFKNMNSESFVYSSEIGAIENKIFQICIINSYESNLYLLPTLIGRVQRGGLIIIISNDINKDKSQFKLSPFNHRLLHLLRTKSDCSIVEDHAISLKLTVSEKFADIDVSAKVGHPFHLCRSEDQKNVLEQMIKSFESDSAEENNHQQISKSATLLTGGTGRGKRTLISLGIVAAIQSEVVDISVLGVDNASLTHCRDNVEKFLLLSGHEATSIYHRRYERFFIVEVVRGTITHKIRFVRFDQQFAKYDTGILCILEAGRLTSAEINKILSFNPKLVWATSSSSGAQSSGSSAFGAMVQPLRSFCGVGETLPNNIETIQTKNTVKICDISRLYEKRHFVGITINAPTIYEEEDPLESVINSIFCLTRKPDVKFDPKCTNNTLPAPSDCDLMYINKETLFSGHDVAEPFLARFMEMYTSFDHKRDNRFLVQLVDDPAHHLFCLQQPANEGKSVPQIISIIHVSLETESDDDTAAGLRIVNLITNAKFQKLGYGRSALNRLHAFFTQPATLSLDRHVLMATKVLHTSTEPASIDSLPKLLVNIVDIAPNPRKIDYIFSRFSATSELLSFWKKCCYLPVRVESVTVTTASCTVMRDCRSSCSIDRIDESAYISLCQRVGEQYMTDLRDIDAILAHEILFHKNKNQLTQLKECNRADLASRFNKRQLLKLSSFVQQYHSFESVQDLVRQVAVIYFGRKLPSVFLPKYQELTLVGLGLQLKSAKQLATELVLAERYQNTKVVDPFSLHKDIQKMIPLILSHVRECVRVFLNQATEIINEVPSEIIDEVPAKKQRLM